VALIAACGSSTPPPSMTTIEPVEEQQSRTPAGTKEDPLIDAKTGLRSWREGDTNVLEANHPVWCKSRYDPATEIDIVECYVDKKRCASEGSTCETRNSAACVTARHVLSGDPIFRCFGSMQTCGEQWIMYLSNTEYAEVAKCFVIRRLK
jgi:hypothetical protein